MDTIRTPRHNSDHLRVTKRKWYNSSAVPGGRPDDITGIDNTASRPDSKAAERERNMKHLQEFANADPAGFAWSIYSDFICTANVLNPLLIHKARGGSPYLDTDIKTLKRVSRWLYVFLQYWLKQAAKSWPEELQAFLNRHEIRVQDDDLDDCDVVKPHGTALTLACIQKVYCTPKTEDEDFYKNYIARASLTRIKSALGRTEYTPMKYPLKDFLKM